jgi:pilus assembly protein Flp/PilA
MRNFSRRLIRSDNGATAIEYSLIAALISVAIVTAVTSVGTHLNTTFNSVSQSL